MAADSPPQEHVSGLAPAQRAEPTPTSGAGAQSRRSGAALLQRYGLLIVWAVVIVGFGIVESESFLTTANFQTMFGSQAVLLVLTMAALIPLTAGDFDLSLSFTLGFSAMMMAILTGEHGWSLGPAIVACLAIGVAIGSINGFWVTVIGLNPFIVTLGTGTMLLGLTQWVSGGRTIGGVSEDLLQGVVLTRVFGISLAFYYGLAICALLWYFLGYTATGRRLLFVGRGRRVARLSGMRVSHLRFGALVASAVLATVAGILLAGYRGSADPDPGGTFLLAAFSAAFLGATAIRPGTFNPWGSFIAVYFLATGIQGLILLGVESYVQNLFYGGALVLGVAFAHITAGKQSDEDSDGVI
jgi:ribose transport system permease protein